MLAHVGRTDGERDKWSSVKCVLFQCAVRDPEQSGTAAPAGRKTISLCGQRFFSARQGLCTLLHAVHAKDSWKLGRCTKSGVPEQLRVGVFHPCQHDTLLRVYTHMPRCQSGHFVCGSVCVSLRETSTSALCVCVCACVRERVKMWKTKQGLGSVSLQTLRCSALERTQLQK